jgi:hypothetical protein
MRPLRISLAHWLRSSLNESFATVLGVSAVICLREFHEIVTIRIYNRLSRRKLPRLAVIVLHVAALALLCSAQSGLNPRSGSLLKDELQAIYHPDPADSWNRIFYCLFTRTVKTHLSQDFSEGAPFTSARVMGPRVSASLIERIEGGDGAIDPLYPSFSTSAGSAQALVEPRYSMLKRALADALGESRDRPALDRALMQSDAWAAFDILSGYKRIADPQGESLNERRSELSSLLARFIRKLALTPEEIKRLPDNYAAASGVHRLPDLFGPRSKWMEIRWFLNRHHDESFRFRRAARVFIKATPLPTNRQAFLNDLRGGGADQIWRIAAAALVIQSLLIDSNGAVVPSPITFEVQQRSFIKDGRGILAKTELGQFEISRKLFLSNPLSGGLVALDDKAGSYLPSSANDYSFASSQFDRAGFTPPTYATLRTRCVSCHESGIKRVLTLAIHALEPPPPVEQLKPSENKHGNYVAKRKMERDDFTALLQEWTTQKN